MAEREPSVQDASPRIDEMRRAIDAVDIAKLTQNVNESIHKFQEEHRVSQGVLDLEISV